ncbi:amino acid permease [Streptomyces sp. NPDC047141]|uniref:APC family permease n=1 Tax=Streptomyces sp. NPDC047141 TaxID=3155738 RepID=UPI003403BC58
MNAGSAAAPPPGLRRALTTPLLHFFILGDVLGAGVYVLVGQVAAASGGAVWVPLLVALVLALLTAASYAELVTKCPRAGGASHYATRAFRPVVGFVAEETRAPRRSYPRARFAALATAGAVYAVYVLVGVAASLTVPTGVLASSTGPLLEVVREAGGVPVRLFSAVALVAVAHGAPLTGIMASRLAYGMARDGLLPAALAQVLPGRRTPWVAIAATTVPALLLALTGSVVTLVLLLLVVFLVVDTAVLVLRSDPGEPDRFRAPTVLPALGAASCVLLATQIAVEVRLRGSAVLALAVVLAVVAAKRRRRPGTEKDTKA